MLPTLSCVEKLLRRKGPRWPPHSVAYKLFKKLKWRSFLLSETHLASWLVFSRPWERATSLEASSMSPGSENLKFVLCFKLCSHSISVMLTTFEWSWCPAVGTLEQQRTPGLKQSPAWGRPRRQSRGCRRRAGKRFPGACHREAPCVPLQDLLHPARHLLGSSRAGQPSCRPTCWCSPQTLSIETLATK